MGSTAKAAVGALELMLIARDSLIVIDFGTIVLARSSSLSPVELLQPVP